MERRGDIIRLQDMLSQFQQTQLWELWLSSEMRAAYFADLCSHFQRQHTRLTWATLLFSSGAAFSFLTNLPNWGKTLMALVVAGLSLYSVVQQNLRKISECSDLSFRWSSLGIQCQELWNNIYVEDAERRLNVLLQKGIENSRSAHTLPNDEKRMLKWEEHVLRHRCSVPVTA